MATTGLRGFFLSRCGGHGDEAAAGAAPNMDFVDILHRRFGRIVRSLHIQYLVDVPWLVSQYQIANQDERMTVLAGKYTETSSSNVDKKKIDLLSIRARHSKYGRIHHAKMTILEYASGEMRVVLPSGNLCRNDWDGTVMQR